MSRAAGTCTRCGATLEDGICPNGHPQRVARRRRRRRWPRIAAVAALVVLAAIGVQVALFRYPVRAAGDLMRPSSKEFVRARSAFDRAVAAIPSADAPDALIEEVGTLLSSADAARAPIADAHTRLEARTPPSIPVISSRPPLRLATQLRERLLDYYVGALEVLADLESVGGYLAELAPVLPRAEDVTAALGRPRTAAQVDDALAVARPIADQLAADLDALTPPPELRSVHESIVAIAGRIREALDELEGARGPGSRPVLTAIVEEIEREADSLAETAVGAPAAALDAGLSRRIEDLDRTARAVAVGLGELRDDYDIAGLSVPEP